MSRNIILPDKKLQEEELLAALRKRDESAVKYVYQTYWPLILRLVKLNSGSEAEAKDLYQECILDFLEKVWNPDFVLTCKLGTYLYSIGRNKWLYSLRGRQKLMDIAEYTHIDELPEQRIEEDIKLPHDHEIINAITALGEPCRSLLIGFYYEELSMEQLATQLNYKSVNVAKQQKFRCKDRLKQAFSEFF
jgi:RNA polymerase sigma factor (sigma-70 family)